METFRKVICRAALFLIASVPLALAQGTYTQIDAPGAVWTTAFGINTAGEITGSYADASGTVHAFLLSSGNYTIIDYPGGYNTSLGGINDLDQVVGDSVSGGGFVYDVSTNTFTTISGPGGTGTTPVAINNAGTIVGYFVPQSGSVQGFELVGSSYTTIAPPHSSLS